MKQGSLNTGPDTVDQSVGDGCGGQAGQVKRAREGFSVQSTTGRGRIVRVVPDVISKELVTRKFLRKFLRIIRKFFRIILFRCG